jgi:hypothetical protein
MGTPRNLEIDILGRGVRNLETIFGGPGTWKPINWVIFNGYPQTDFLRGGSRIWKRLLGVRNLETDFRGTTGIYIWKPINWVKAFRATPRESG